MWGGGLRPAVSSFQQAGVPHTGFLTVLCSTVHSEDFQEHPTQASDQTQIYFYLAAMGGAVNAQWKEKEERREHQLKYVKAMGIGNIIQKAGSGCL